MAPAWLILWDSLNVAETMPTLHYSFIHFGKF